MVKKLFLFLVFVIIFNAPAFAQTPSDSDKFSPNEIIVKFKENVTQDQINKLNQELGAQVSKKLSLPKVFTLKVPEKQTAKYVDKYNKSTLVEYAEPDFQAEALQELLPPNDTYFSNQWGLPRVQALEAWDINEGSASTQIAILDTGIDKDHEDLVKKVDKWINFTASITDDDLYGHGTHVAGIAAAETDNHLGVAGLGYNTHLISVKVLDDKGSGYYSWIIEGIKWASDNNIKVINLSLGGPSRSKALEEAVDYAFNHGSILTCAAGNSGNKSPTYPAYYKNCIAIAATDENDKKASFSSFGSWVDVAAPGVNIFSTFPNHPYKIGKNVNYGYGSGTSMATPFVAGLAGLLFGADPGLSAVEVRSLIENNADKIAGTGNYWSKGRINAYHSITAIPSIALPTNVEKNKPKTTPTPLPVSTSNEIPLSPAPTSSSNLVQSPGWCSLLIPLCQES
ncbi:MAG: S8 family peptidase [Candidatus Gottesmanbacteria bacterium]